LVPSLGFEAGRFEAGTGDRGRRGGRERRAPREYRPKNQDGQSDQTQNPNSAPATRPNTHQNDYPSRRGRPRNFQRQNYQDQTPSKTTLFVTNLPFSVSDSKFESIFENLQVKKAFVVKNRFGFSKGYGFVEFENEELQQAALAQKQDTVVEGRPLIVKVARNLDKPVPSSDSPPSSVPKTESPKQRTETPQS